MWEVGSRYNVGERELHASSLGMVKVCHGLCIIFVLPGA